MERRKRPIIALAQIKYFDDNSKNNVKKIKKYINLAKERKADIVCFPESCINKVALPNKNHKFINEIREECKKNKIWCIITEDIKIKEKKYNISLLINRNGEIFGDYKKINLYGPSFVTESITGSEPYNVAISIFFPIFR